MQISTLQINQDQLNAFISNSISGGTWSGIAQAYFAASGYAGPVVYLTGGTQFVNGTKVFVDAPLVPTTSLTGAAANILYVLNGITGSLLSFSGFIDGQYVNRSSTQSITGTKNFLTAITVPTATGPTEAINLNYLLNTSGVLQNEIDTVSVANVVFQSGNQIISGVKSFVSSPLVPAPIDLSGVVNVAYLNNLGLTGVATLTDDQTFAGVNTFTQSPVIPIGVSSNAPVTKSQLDAVAISVGGSLSGFAGVTSIQGLSGAVPVQGYGTVQVTTCSGVLRISGDTSHVAPFYAASIPLPNGTTGITYSYTTPFTTVNSPLIIGNIVLSGISGQFFEDLIYNPNNSGFSVALNGAVPGPGYQYNVWVVPTGASGFSTLVGPQGNNGSSPNARGAWAAGNFYNVLDYTFTQASNFTSFICTSGHISTVSNFPGGTTGNAFWQIFSSGQQGSTGSFVFQGAYNTGTTYQYNYSTTSSGSTYGFTGVSIQNVYPDTLTGGWVMLAQKGSIGSYINSGIVTGNFYSLSFFVDPATTGRAVGESWVSSTWLATGWAIGAVTSGAGSDIATPNAIFTGRLYSRALDNTTTTLVNFTFNSGLYSYFSGSNLSIPITGASRVGLDIISTLSGLSKVSVGLFGFGF